MRGGVRPRNGKGARPRHGLCIVRPERQQTEGELALACLVAAVRSVRVSDLWTGQDSPFDSESHFYAVLDPERPQRPSSARLYGGAAVVRAAAARLLAASEAAEAAALAVDVENSRERERAECAGFLHTRNAPPGETLRSDDSAPSTSGDP